MKHQWSIVAFIVILAAIAAVGIAGLSGTQAAAVDGSSKIVKEVVTALPTADTNGSAQNHIQYGDAEAWINPTEVPTAFVGTVKMQQAASQSGPWIDVTPTALSGSGTITYDGRGAPIVWVPAENNGAYSRIVVSNTSAITAGISVRWKLSNTQ